MKCLVLQRANYEASTCVFVRKIGTRWQLTQGTTFIVYQYTLDRAASPLAWELWTETRNHQGHAGMACVHWDQSCFLSVCSETTFNQAHLNV